MARLVNSSRLHWKNILGRNKGGKDRKNGKANSSCPFYSFPLSYYSFRAQNWQNWMGATGATPELSQLVSVRSWATT